MAIIRTLGNYLEEIKRYNKSRLDSNANDLLTYKNRLKDLYKTKKNNSYYANDVKSAKNNINYRQADTLYLKKSYPKSSVKDLVEEFKRLTKHQQIDKINISETSFVVFTKMLKASRHTIGNFRIKIPFNTKSINITNLYGKGNGLPHWFVNYTGIPCFGEWKNEIIDKIFDLGELYLGISNIIAFLQSSYKSQNGFCSFPTFISNFVVKRRSINT